MKQRSLSLAAQIALGGALLLILLCALFAFFATGSGTTDTPPALDTGLKVTPLAGAEQGKTMLLKTADDTFAAKYFPTLFGAKGDGVADDTAPLKQALELARQDGGTVYLPRGVYRITEPIVLPAGVTLRGEFASPDAAASERTILMASDRDSLRNASLFTLENGATLTGITVYYEAQRPEAIIPYPAAVFCAGTAAIRNLALINPYHGISITGDGEVALQGVWMSPLDYGVMVTEKSGSVYLENISISPTYWLNTLPDLFSQKGTYDTLTRYLHEHLHGIVFETVANVTLNRYSVENASVGLLLNTPAETDGLLLASELSITTTNRPLSLQSLPADGVLFANSVFRPTSDTGADTVALGARASAPVLFVGCTFAGTPKTVIHGENPGFLSFYHCNFGTWWNTCFNLTDSTFLTVSPTFRTQEDKATLGKNAFGLLYGSDAEVNPEELLFAVSVQNAETSTLQTVSSLQDRPRNLPTEIVNAADFGLSKEAANNSEALKKAIESALLKKAILFIPEGTYNFTEALFLPKNLRLVGAGHQGAYKTTLTFHSAPNAKGGMIHMEEGAALENLEILQAWTGSDLYAVFSNESNVTLRNLSIRATRGIGLNGGTKTVIEHVNLTVSALGISLNGGEGTLRRIALTDASGTSAVGIQCTDGTASLSGIHAKALSCGISVSGSAQVKGTLLDFESVKTGVLTADSATVTLSAFVVAGAGEASASTFLHVTGGTLTAQGMICHGTDNGNALLSAGGKSTLTAALFSAEIPVTIQSAGGETRVMGCVWNKTPTFHAAANAGTITLNGNLLPASAVFEGIEGNYLTVSATENGKIEDGVNVMDFTYVEGEEDAESGSGASDAQTNKPPLE